MRSLSSQRYLSVFLFFGGSFLLHLLWENLQAPLYAEYVSFTQHFWICFRATVGDLLVMLLIYLALAGVHGDILWAADKRTYSQPLTWILSVLIGIVFAMSYEWWAVNVAHRWAYSTMPILPWIGIGLAPILQMIIIPPLVLLLSRSVSLSTKNTYT